jgi:hypothetical protein
MRIKGKFALAQAMYDEAKKDGATVILRRRANLSLAGMSIERVSQIQSDIDRSEPDTVLRQLLTQP